MDRRDRGYALEVEARMWILGINRTDVFTPDRTDAPEKVMAEVAAR